MTYYSEKSTLPPTELGDRRQLQMGYFGHGDIFIAAWTGSLDLDPHREDGISTCFNLAHGCDLLLLASCVGYLRRIGRPEQEVRRVIVDAGRGVIEDDLGDIRGRRPGGSSSAKWVAGGTHFQRFDKDGLESLVTPMPAQPGVLDRVGGTAIYTRPNPSDKDLLVYASLRPGGESGDGVQIYETADFCPEDIPTIAELICNMAQGEYRRDLRWLLDDESLLGENSTNTSGPE